MIYEYDMGDSWEHLIEATKGKRDLAKAKVELEFDYPRLISGKAHVHRMTVGVFTGTRRSRTNSINETRAKRTMKKDF
jgi:hypothetical protein